MKQFEHQEKYSVFSFFFCNCNFLNIVTLYTFGKYTTVQTHAVWIHALHGYETIFTGVCLDVLDFYIYIFLCKTIPLFFLSLRILCLPTILSQSCTVACKPLQLSLFQSTSCTATPLVNHVFGIFCIISFTCAFCVENVK